MFKRLQTAAALFMCAAILSAPASAKVSLGKARQICEGAAKILQPTPRSARVDRDEVRATSTAITIFLVVQTMDDRLVTVSCTVDRETSMATLMPSTLGPSTASKAPAR